MLDARRTPLPADGLTVSQTLTKLYLRFMELPDVHDQSAG
jgi:hypothetical protein